MTVKTLYLDCGMGAAGDMLAAALLELHPAPEDFLKRINCLGLPRVTVSAEPAIRCGITGTGLKVTIGGVVEETEELHHGGEKSLCPEKTDRLQPHAHEHTHAHTHAHTHIHHHPSHSHDHSHTGYAEIEKLIAALELPEKVKADALAVYRIIAEAEAKVHGRPVSQIHFHEVGMLDAAADIIAVALLLYELAPEKTIATPVCTGTGHVHCAHGILPVPAPATLEILKGIPVYGGTVRSELCTPTGAALLKHFVTAFAPMPLMKVENTGYGMGKKNFEQANCVRAIYGEAL